MGVVRIVLVVALVAGAAALGGDPAFAKGPPKPVISGFAATPATVGSGGSTTITASVSNAKECTVSSNKPVASLPETFNCESGPVDSEVTMPANAGKKPLKVKLTLTAVGAGGKAKAKATVEVTTADFKIEKLQRVEGEVGYTTGEVTAELGQGIQYEVLVTNTGKLPLKFSEVKDGGCEGISPSGSTELQAGKSETLTCRHTPTGLGTYANDASIEGNEGTGTKTSDSVSASVKMQNALQISAGGEHTCAALSTGHIACWGRNKEGQLGDGTTTGSDTPVEVQGISDAIQVSAGRDFTCAVLSTGHIDCWGENEEGQLGDGTTTGSDTPVEVQGISNASKVAAAGESNTCALLASGHIECWGNNIHGQLGNENSREPPHDTPVEVVRMSDATDVGASGTDTCALLSTGQVDCWGDNLEGQVGNGETGFGAYGEPENWEYPVEVLNISDGTQVGVGTVSFACALHVSGEVACWGNNEHGQLGDDNSFNRPRQDEPVAVEGISTATQLSTGRAHACALLEGGQIDCWGEGGLGNPTAHEKQFTPLEVQGVSNATQVSAGGDDTCALLPGHQIDCWGANASGQLGNGTTTSSTTPVEVEGT